MIGTVAASGDFGVRIPDDVPIILFEKSELAGHKYKHFRITIVTPKSPVLISFDGGKTYASFVPGGGKGYDLINDNCNNIGEGNILVRRLSSNTTIVFSSIW